MTVPREYTVNDFAINDTFAQATPAQGAGAASGGNMLLQGATLRTSTAFGRAATVKAGEDIRPALESLRSAGGGTLILLAGVHRPTYDIVGGSKINIVGEGIGQTIIDFGDLPYRVQYAGTASVLVDSFFVKDITITNSFASSAMQLNHCGSFAINNVEVTSCDQKAFEILSSWYFTLDRVYGSLSGTGLYLEGTSARPVRNFDILNSDFSSNYDHGVSVYASTGGSFYYGSFVNVRVSGNLDNGFVFNADSLVAVVVSLLGCLAVGNGAVGFLISTNCQRIFFSNCIAQSNTGNGFEINATDCTILGGYTSDAIVVNANCTVLGIYNSDITTFGANAFASEVRTRDDLPKESRRTIASVNKSGGTLTKGTVVVWGTSVNGDEYTTSTTVGDDRVLGVVNAVTANNYGGYVLVEGFTDSLKVNGTTDIAVGDFLCTYSVAGIAAKAAAGDMAFAIALEAYTTNDSNGVIDALIISPRKL